MTCLPMVFVGRGSSRDRLVCPSDVVLKTIAAPSSSTGPTESLSARNLTKAFNSIVILPYTRLSVLSFELGLLSAEVLGDVFRPLTAAR